LEKKSVIGRKWLPASAADLPKRAYWSLPPISSLVIRTITRRFVSRLFWYNLRGVKLVDFFFFFFFYNFLQLLYYNCYCIVISFNMGCFFFRFPRIPFCAPQDCKEWILFLQSYSILKNFPDGIGCWDRVIIHVFGTVFSFLNTGIRMIIFLHKFYWRWNQFNLLKNLWKCFSHTTAVCIIEIILLLSLLFLILSIFKIGSRFAQQIRFGTASLKQGANQHCGWSNQAGSSLEWRYGSTLGSLESCQYWYTSTSPFCASR